MADINRILQDRGSNYGNYLQQAKISSSLSDLIDTHCRDRGTVLDADMRDALRMICVKVSRVVNGNPRYSDNWADIAGYAKLVADRLEREERGDA